MSTYKEYLTGLIKASANLEYLDSLQFGTFIRALMDANPTLTVEDKHCCIEKASSELRDSGHMNSAEFYEGLNDCVPSYILLQILKSTYLDDSVNECEFCRVVSSLSSSGAINLSKARLFSLRECMTPQHLRGLLAMIADNSCDDIISVQLLLRRVFHPSEEYEVAEALRTMVKQDWFVDIVPRNQAKAMKLFRETIIPVFPSTERVLEDWVNGVEEDSDFETDDGESLKDFIVSDDDSSSSTVSEEKLDKVTKSQASRKRSRVVISDSE